MLSWMADIFPTTHSPPPVVTQSDYTPLTIECIQIPADGSDPHMVRLETTYINDDKLDDCFLFHIPDVRVFWTFHYATDAKSEEGIWRKRTLRRVDVADQHTEALNGSYYFFRCIDGRLQRNLHFRKDTTVRGDVFVAKVKDWDGWSEPAEYIDVPTEFVETREGKITLRRMMDAFVSACTN